MRTSETGKKSLRSEDKHRGAKFLRFLGRFAWKPEFRGVSRSLNSSFDVGNGWLRRPEISIEFVLISFDEFSELEFFGSESWNASQRKLSSSKLLVLIKDSSILNRWLLEGN